MDLTTTPTPTTTPDTDNDTPPHHTQQVKHFSTSSLYSNGTVKKHHYPSYHHQVPFVDGHGVVVAGGINNNNIVYRECLKNHAASLGGHALDGCGEFMPAAGVDPTDPITTTTTTSLKCAACGCHRNFHRREPDHHDQYYPSSTPQMMMIPHFLDFRHPPPPPPGRTSSPSPSPSPPPPHPQPTQSFAPQMLLALSSAADHHHQPQQHVATPVTPTAVMKSENLSGRKRFRTKFTQEQKEKMHSFSEKLGWKLQKCDDAMVKDFCNEIGVARSVLKVWMHNNKNTLGKKDGTATAAAATTAATTNYNNNNGSSLNMNTINNNDNDNNASHYHNEKNREVAPVHLHTSTNGSSSSS